MKKSEKANNQKKKKSEPDQLGQPDRPRQPRPAHRGLTPSIFFSFDGCTSPHGPCPLNRPAQPKSIVFLLDEAPELERYSSMASKLSHLHSLISSKI
jgi:hypothetical protein